MKQAEIIKNLTDKQIREQLYVTQFIFIIISLLLSLFLFDSFSTWKYLFSVQFMQIILFGVVPALGLVGIEIILSKIIAAHHLDDGGINERVFKNQSVFHVFCISMIVAISEEVLFRGVIQTTFGFVFASTLFIIVHFRYLKKPVLLIAIIITSFGIGYLYEVTNNLLVTIVFHFIVDFLLGLYIKFRK